MKNQKRKTLDDFSDESEHFESQFELLLAGQHDESGFARLVAAITEWMQECARQGLYVPLASAERRAFRSLLERWSSRLRNQGYYAERIASLADFDPNAGFVLTGDCPYPGLEPYAQDRRESFFGREALVASLVGHLEQQEHRILLIVGASGSGKSSLALAGILPRLVELHDGAWLFGPRLTPGAHPLAELAEAVAQAIGRPGQTSEIERALAANPDKASDQLAALCQNKPLMLFIDQFEELLTMCRDTAEQSLFAQVLCALSEPAASSNGFSCRILLTLRTDHLARFESNNALKHLHMRLVGEDNQHYLSAIGFEDIKRAIKGPADEVGLRFIPATLIDQLASQTAGLSNGLPLLQFALRRLWDTRPRNASGEPLDLINAEMVQALPDVERALGALADSIFRTFSDSQKRVCERLFLELLVLDESFEEPLRRRRNEAELTQVLEAQFPAPGEVASVIESFVAARLLRRFGEGPNGRIEVAHEALLRHWDHVYRIVTGAEVKERLHLIKQIGREGGDWAGHDRSNDYLGLRGERLARAIAYRADGWLAEAEAAEYVDACRASEDEERRRDRLAKEEKERADLAQRARESAELQAMRAGRKMWQAVAVAVIVFAAGLAVAFYLLIEQNKRNDVERFESLAWNSIRDYESTNNDIYATEAADYANKALKRDPDSGTAWFILAHAELALEHEAKAVAAFDKVPPSSAFYADALSNAASIYFEQLHDDQAAYQRLKLAVERVPDNLGALSNYAEMLLALGRDREAKEAAARVREYADTKAYEKAAMSFVMFAAELLSGDSGKAMAELDAIEHYVNPAAAKAKEAEEEGRAPEKWQYKGIRRSLEQRLGTDSTGRRSTLLMVLTFVETDGKKGTLDQVRQQLGSQPAKE